MMYHMSLLEIILSPQMLLFVACVCGLFFKVKGVDF
jgi:hypothetical protein